MKIKRIRWDNKSFINYCSIKHNNLYDYSLLNYIKNTISVSIICSEHGIFKQLPKNHINGSGCPICAKKISKPRITYTELVERFEKIHNNIFDYSLVEETYTTMDKKVSIICSEHGIFEQLPSNHLAGKICAKCKGRNKTSEDYINIVKNIHNNKYTYVDTIYINRSTKIKIGCSEHGTFEQTAENHIRGTGCPRCKSSKGELEIIKYLDQYNITYTKEKCFENCISPNNNMLKFDFYLPYHNLCIEYDGIQHFCPIGIFGGINGYKKVLIYDNIKNIFCLDNKITLLRIPYTEYNNISKILNKYLIYN